MPSDPFSGIAPEKKPLMAERLTKKNLFGSWFDKGLASLMLAEFDRKPMPIGELLDREMGKIMNADALRLVNLRNGWDKAVGAQAAALCQAERYENGLLFVAVRHPAFLRELKSCEQQFIQAINRFLGTEFCKGIRFTPGNFRVPNPGTR